LTRICSPAADGVDGVRVSCSEVGVRFMTSRYPRPQGSESSRDSEQRPPTPDTRLAASCIQVGRRVHNAIYNVESAITGSQFQRVVSRHIVSLNCHYNRCTTMAESNVAGEHFAHLVEYALAVCKECRHGVLPSHIKSHVQRAYPAKRKQAKAIAEEVHPSVACVQGRINVPTSTRPPRHGPDSCLIRYSARFRP
jgi:hypothetical protein